MGRFGGLYIVDGKRRIVEPRTIGNRFEGRFVVALVAIRDVLGGCIGELLDIFTRVCLEMLFPNIRKNAHRHHHGHGGDKREGHGYASGVRKAKKPIVETTSGRFHFLVAFFSTLLLSC